MTKYKLEFYGWELEGVGHSLTDEQVVQIKEIVEENGYKELWETRSDLEEKEIIDDLYNPDLFHVSRCLWNSGMWFSIKDESDNEVLRFDGNDVGDIYDFFGDEADNMERETYVAIPEYIDGTDNVLVVLDENKGGIGEYDFESETIPTPKDFCLLDGMIETPDGDWDFVSKIFFKGKELEMTEHLDNNGKASTIEIYTRDGQIIK
jgi:hypothetical protein